MITKPSKPDLTAELEDVRARLAEAEAALRAVRNGEVDAVVVAGERGKQVYTLSGADRIYRQFIETMSEGAATLSANGDILYCNARLAGMLGRTLDQVLGTALRNYLPPADQQALDVVLAQARTEPSRREINLKTSEGRLTPVYLSASHLQSNAAEVVFCLVFTDLTEQKSHEQIAAMEQQARLILEQAAEAIIVCDEQGRIIRASRAAQQICDGSPLLRPFAEVFPLRTDASDSFPLAPILQGETLRNVDVALDRQGQKFDLILNAGPLFNDQQILGCVVTLTDITERKRSEEELRVSQQIVEGILNAIPVRVFWKDKNLVYLGCNEIFARDAGFASSKDIIGKDDYQMGWRDQAESYRSDDRQVIESGCSKLLIEEPQTTPEGKTITLLTNKLPLRNSNGEISGLLGTYMDITDRKLAENQLRDSEMRYRRLFEAAKDGVLLLDAETGMVTDVNPFLIKLLDFSHEQFLNKAVWDLGFFKDVWANQAKFMELQQTGYVRYDDLPLETADGRKIHVEFVSNVYAVDHHKVIQCNVRDITEHKRTEAAIREQEEENRTILKTTMEGVFMFDRQGRFLEVNDTYCSLLGYSRDELLRMSIPDVEADETPVEVAETLQRIMQEGKAQFERRQRRKDGTLVDLDVSCNFISTSSGRFVCFLRDITERKRSEVVLRESEEELRMILKTTMEGFSVADLQGRYLEVNDTFCSMTGYSRDELLRMSVPDLEANETGVEVTTQLQRVIEEGKAQFERRHRRKDGTPMDVDISLNFVPIHGGRLVCFLRDITERKRREAERVTLDEQLRQAQKMESVGQLAGGVAHDFNNILTGISGYTELALERLDPASPMREDLAEVLRLSKRAAELTRQLLAFSRRQMLEQQVLNINDMIADTAKMLKRVLSENIDLQFVPAPNLGNVRADPMQLEQVLMNLAINARDAMPAGGKLTIETANVELDADYAGHHVSVIPGRYVMMAVSDTGHGMDAATQSHLFEPFFTTKEKGKGTGLGLATAYGIVKQHGGNIWVYTEPGNGATFKVYLPRAEEAASAAKPAADPGMSRGEETILIVEDEPAVRAVAERALKARGYALLTASNAEQAESLFSEHPERISLLLTDVVLPGINGRMLYDRLKSKKPDLKVLYMSGYTDNAIVHQGTLDTSVAFMQKPFTVEMAARKVRQVLDG